MLYENECTTFSLCESDRWDFLRHFWHLHGQSMSWVDMQRTLSRMHIEGSTTSHVSVSAQPSGGSFSQQPWQYQPCTQIEDFGLWWQDVVSEGRRSGDRLPVFISTWFLSVDEMHLCVRPRRIRLTDDLTFARFQHQCAETWRELINGLQLSFHLVEGRPEGLPSTIAHVIIVQGVFDAYNAILLKGNLLPPLMSTRAVLFEQHIQIRNLFQVAQFPDTCDRSGYVCMISYTEGGQDIMLTTVDIADIPLAKFVHANMRVVVDIEDEEVSDSSTIEPVSEAGSDDSISFLSAPFDLHCRVRSSAPDASLPSWCRHHHRVLNSGELGCGSLPGTPGTKSRFETHGGVDASLEKNPNCYSQVEFEPSLSNGSSTAHSTPDQDEDSYSWMTTGTMVWQFDHPDPYPWQTFEQEPPPEAEDDPDEGTSFAEGHFDRAQDFIVLAEEELSNSIQPWTAITFSVGLVDLGRRDVGFDPDRLEDLPGIIEQLWADHHQYGDLTIYCVHPQPSEIGGVRTLVLIVVVENPDDVHPDIRNILVIPRGPADAHLRPVPYAAKIFTELSVGEVLVQLDLLHKCKPFAMRECLIRLGFQTMLPGQLYDVDHGMLCSVRVHERPPEVFQAMQTIDNVETFFLQLEEVQRLAEEVHQVICQVHAISPGNRPMGSRQLILEGNDLLDIRWISELRQLWTFPSDDVRITFCTMVTGDLREISQPVFHFVIDFGLRVGVPVLVEQQVVVADDVPTTGGITREFLAIALMEGQISADVVTALSIPPFWFGYALNNGIQPHVQVNGRRIGEIQEEWKSGDFVAIKMHVWKTHQLLSILVHEGDPREEDSEVEVTTLLQTNLRSRKPHIGHEALRQDDFFGEYCRAIFHRYTSQQSTPVPCLKNMADPSGVQPLPFSPPKDADHDDLLRSMRLLLSELFDDGWQGLNHDFAAIPFTSHRSPCLSDDSTSAGLQRHISCVHRWVQPAAQISVALVVITEVFWQGQRFFFRIGYASAMVTEDLGPVTSSAMDAEATAIIAGVEYFLSCQLPAGSDGIDVTFHYDALAVGHGACGQQNTPQSKEHSSERQHAARIMLSILQQKASSVKGLHVKAHNGHPWNECADSIATLTRKGWQPPQPALLRSGNLLQHPLRDWAWMEVHHSRELPGLDRILFNEQAQPNQGLCDPQLAPCSTRLPGTTSLKMPSQEDVVPTDVSKDTHTMSLRMATMNVGTLHPVEDSHAATICSMKAAEILRQRQLEQLHAVGVQESRARQNQMLVHGPFTRLISKGDRGQAGVELWLDTDALAKIFATDFQPAKDMCVWHSDSRILAARCQLGTSVIEFLVLYAPQRGRGTEEQTDWWHFVDEVLCKRDRQATLVILGDCNCSVGSVSSNAIGEVAPDFEDTGGACLRKLCEDHGLIIPSTFSHWHVGPSNTYTGARGGSSRIDYILISAECAPGIASSFVHQDFDLLNGDHDHLPMVLECTIQVRKKCNVGNFRKSSLYNREMVRSGCSPPHLQRLMSDAPLQSWEMDVNDHWNGLRQHLQSTVQSACPCVKRQRRQLYFSDDAWNKLCDRKDVRQQHRALQRAKNHLILAALFHHWKAGKNCEEEIPFTRLNLHLLQCQEALCYERKLKMNREFKDLKRRDWKFWTQSQLEEKIKAAKDVKAQDLLTLIRPKQMIAKSSGKLLKPLPGYKDSDGSWRKGREDIALAWQVQFSRLEHGEDVAFSDLLQRSSQTHCMPRSAQDLLSVPTIYELEQAIRNLHPGKAPGLDGLGAEILQLALQEAARRIYPILLKAAVRGQGVVEWAGGWLIPLFKGKGNVCAMSGYRAILLESTISRAVSRSWRPKLLNGLDTVTHTLQCGGRPGLSIEALHLHVQFWRQRAISIKQSMAVIFLDIRAAFYSIIKQMVAGEAAGMRDLSTIFKKMGLPVEMYHEFIQQVQNINLIKQATGSDLISGHMAAMLSHTWFVVQDGRTIQSPMTGSRPGDPNADVLFTYVLAKILKVISHRAESSGIPLVHASDHGPISDMVTWVDDIAIAAYGEAEEITAKVSTLLSIVQDAMLEHGLELSYGAGKTAVMFSFHGPKSGKARQAMEKDYAQGIPLLSKHKGRTFIPIVSHYRHLGGFLTRSGSRLPELRVRIAVAMSKLKPLRRVLAHSGLPNHHKAYLVKCLGLSTYTLHAGTFFNLTQGEFLQWQAGVHRIYQMMVSKPRDGSVRHHNAYQLADMMQSPMPMELMNIYRLRLFVHILRAGDVAMISAILENFELQNQSSWLSGLFHALRWMKDQVGEENIPEELLQLTTVQDWLDFQDAAFEIKKLVKKAEKAHLFKVSSMCQLQVQGHMQDQLLREMGWTLEKDSSDNDSPQSTSSFQCDECMQTFATAASLAVHQQRKHRGRVALRRVITVGACRACGRYYHTRPRLLKHLQTAASRCWVFHLRCFKPVSEEEADRLDANDRQIGVAAHQKDLVDHGLDKAWRWCTSDEMRSVLSIQEGFVDTKADPTPEELASWRKLGMLPPGQGGRELTKRRCSDLQIHNVGKDATDFELRRLELVKHWRPAFDWVPGMLAEGQKYFLIMYSGHRRWQDMATFIWWESDLIPICIDVAIDQKWGDMMKDSLWIDLIRARKVSGGHAGPPCETFSFARWLEQDDTIYPRPLRDVHQPWGKDNRTLRETRQWMVGNQLLWKAFWWIHHVGAPQRMRY